MNPNYNQTITVYSKSKDSQNREVWTRQVIRGCFFKAATGTVQSGNTLKAQNVYVARIPAASGQVLLHEGDIVVRGEIPDEVTGKSPNTAVEVLKRYQPDAFRVNSFSDNTNFPIDKHYRAGG